ncbi:hypothetical protein WJX72_007787 [[Myrmecia] bisecta]|uniref:1-phosphatidylinositol 4-kinase n=1 Tax=[Myrmecia] bisecta TaxID=41462 RepID=A0AAW1Q1C1_9CHLO
MASAGTVVHRPVPALWGAGGAPPEGDLLVLLQRPRQTEGGTVLETVQICSNQTIKELKVKLRSLKGWFSSKHALVLGDRELLEHEVVGALAAAAKTGSLTPGYLHVVVKLSDVESVTASTALGAELSFGHQLQNSPRSALTASLAESLAEDAVSEQRLVPKSSILSRVSDSRSNGEVVHLIIRRSANIGWQRGSRDKFELSISSADTAEDLKRRLQERNGLAADEHKLLFNGRVLSSTRPLASFGIQQGSVLELMPVEPPVPSSLPAASPPLSSPEHELFAGWQKACAGLAKGHAPKLAPAGTGGAYFLCDEDGSSVAVFKPEDEEPLAVHNPRGNSSRGRVFDGHGFRKGISPGEGAVREVAAFVLDYDHFSGVPPTALVSCQEHNPSAVGQDTVLEGKVGSLQQFVTADGDCEERGPSAFPIEQVHKICVLDIRLANTDRNGGNILARRTEAAGWELIPIDHGYCLPSTFQDISFEWLYWPQARASFSERSLKYISQLDAAKDLSILAAHGLQLRPECERVLKVCTMLLKKAAAKGLTAFDIGSVMCRESLTKSPLEKLHSRAVALASGQHEHSHGKPSQGGFSQAVYLEHMGQLLDEYLAEQEEEFVLEGLV